MRVNGLLHSQQIAKQMKSLITVYKQNDITPIETITLNVKEGIATYNDHSYLVFKKDGHDAIFSDDPIINPIDRIPDDVVVKQALKIINKRIVRGPFLENPQDVKDLFILRHKDLTTEHFDVAFLCNKHRLLKISTLFKGGPSAASVYPAVVIQRMLLLNAQAIIVSHNHPNGTSCTPSAADVEVTQEIQRMCQQHSLRLLDHVITSGPNAISLAEMGTI